MFEWKELQMLVLENLNFRQLLLLDPVDALTGKILILFLKEKLDPT